MTVDEVSIKNGASIHEINIEMLETVSSLFASRLTFPSDLKCVLVAKM